jgi:hypothetical protein
MRALATSLLIIFSLSITGYALLDATHELLHNIKNPFHRHKVKTHAHKHDDHGHHHHHVEDHHKFLTKADTSDKQAPSVSISWYFLFFHGAPLFKTPPFGFDDFAWVLNTKLPIVFLIPPLPPPLRSSVIY